MGVLDWFKRKKKKTEEPSQTTEQIPIGTKGEVKPSIKKARPEEKTKTKRGKRRKKTV